LERLFAETTTSKSDGQAPGTAIGVGRQRPRARVFEEGRRRQICVMLARLPSVDTTVQAIAEMDDTKLDKDQIDLLLANLPSTAELAALHQAAKDMESQEGGQLAWDDAEAFVLRLSRVPSFAARLQLWAFENGFQEHFGMFDAAATEVTAACQALQTSPRIRRLLSLALSLGNYLNAGTSRGRADGFAAESLLQMCMLKATGTLDGTSVPRSGNATPTLLDFLVYQLEKARPGDLERVFGEGSEALCVRLAARHKLADLVSELDAYKRDAEGLTRRAVAPEVDEALRMRGRRAEVRLVRELGPLQQRLRAGEAAYRELCTWFHEGGGFRQPRPSNEFFMVWDDFLQAVRSSLEGLNRGRARRRRAAAATARRPLEQIRRSMNLDDTQSCAPNSSEGVVGSVA